ncbi:MAG: hypothetical protein EBX57_09590, partial [Betaproteobacteria bacterium]|nr:hypothetical protein [Betaproteobacteria bacterium]
MIRSRSHALVQTLRKLASDPALRRELSLCVLPGERLIEDWIRQGAKLNKVLIPARWLAKPESAQTLLRWQIGSHEAGMSADEAAGWFLLEGGLAEGVSGLGFETVPIALASFCEQASLPAPWPTNCISHSMRSMLMPSRRCYKPNIFDSSASGSLIHRLVHRLRQKAR